MNEVTTASTLLVDDVILLMMCLAVTLIIGCIVAGIHKLYQVLKKVSKRRVIRGAVPNNRR